MRRWVDVWRIIGRATLFTREGVEVVAAHGVPHLVSAPAPTTAQARIALALLPELLAAAMARFWPARTSPMGISKPLASEMVSFCSPLSPAHGSACPTFALTPPSASGAADSPRHAPATVATKEPTSIGSPSAVPVPCASHSTTEAASTPASANAAPSKPCCACPFGAVKNNNKNLTSKLNVTY